MKQIPAHPLADLFPLIAGPAYKELCEDIRERGLIDPVVLHSDQVLDGRNRMRACAEVGAEPRFVEFSSLKLKVTPEQYIWSKNIARRHLSDDQRAGIAMQWRDKVAVEARERQREAGKEHGRGKRGKVMAKSPEAIEQNGTTRHKLAETAQVSEHKIRIAEQVAEHCPHLLTKVAAGEIKLSEAKRSTEEVKKIKGLTGGGSSKPRKRQGKRSPDLDASSYALRIYERVKEEIAKVPKEKHERLLKALRNLMEKMWT